MGSLRTSEKFIESVVSGRENGDTYKRIASSLDVSNSFVGTAIVAHNAGCSTIVEYINGLAREREYGNSAHYRRIKKVLSEKLGEGVVPTGGLLLDVVDENNGGYERCVRQEMDDELKALVGKLKPDVRDIINKYYFKGISLLEIAEDIGVSKQWVHAKKKLGLEALRFQLTDWQELMKFVA